MSKWAIKDLETGEIEAERFDTEAEAMAEFEGDGGDYDYYKIVEVEL